MPIIILAYHPRQFLNECCKEESSPCLRLHPLTPTPPHPEKNSSDLNKLCGWFFLSGVVTTTPNYPMATPLTTLACCLQITEIIKSESLVHRRKGVSNKDLRTNHCKVQVCLADSVIEI